MKYFKGDAILQNYSFSIYKGIRLFGLTRRRSKLRTALIGTTFVTLLYCLIKKRDEDITIFYM